MFNLKNFARQAMLAGALAIASAAAVAGPTYLVTIHTAGVDAEAGVIDFSFYTTDDVLSSTAVLSNFSGAFGEEFDRSGTADGSIADTLTFTQGMTTNYLIQNVIFGGDFSFEVSFSGDFETVPGLYAAALQVALYDSLQNTDYGMAVYFDLIPALNADAASVFIGINDPGLASVTQLAAAADVPEPSQLLLMLSALALAGLALRRSSAQHTR